MSRQRQHGDRDHAEVPASSQGAPELAADQGELLGLGNQALTERSGLGAAGAEGGELGGRVGLALRLAPRDPAWSERLIAAVERSGLAAERKEAITTRLRWDQVHADDVAAAVRGAFDADTPELRASLVEAVESGPGPVDELARRITDLTQAPPDRAGELVRALGLVRPLWDEEEEEDPPEYPDLQF